MHGVALPDNDVARVADRRDVGREVLGDLVGAITGDEGHLSDFAVGVEDVEERGEVGGRHAGTDFDTDGVAEAAEELDVGVGELAGAVPDPEEVRGGVVVAGVGRSGRREPGGKRGFAVVLWRCGVSVVDAVAFRAFRRLEEAWNCVGWVFELPGQALFVFEEEAFVGGEEVDSLEAAAGVEADGAHHVESVGDALRDALVFVSERGVQDVA